MLTPQMTQTETVSQVMQDMKWLQGRAQTMGYDLKRQLKAQMRTGQQTVCIARELTLPQGNRWTVMLVWHLERQEMPSMVYFTTMQTDEGLYVYAPNASPERGMLCFIYTPHFLRRYRERMGLREDMAARQVARRYLRDNNDGHIQRAPDYKGRPSWTDSTHDGVALGEYVSLRLFIAKTFVRRDMAYAGRQERAFARGERRRKRGRREGDLRMLQSVIRGENNLRRNLRACDEAMEAEKRQDERERGKEQALNENEKENADEA